MLKMDQNHSGQKFSGHFDHAESESAAEIGGKSLGPKSEVIADARLQHGGDSVMSTYEVT